MVFEGKMWFKSLESRNRLVVVAAVLQQCLLCPSVCDGTRHILTSFRVVDPDDPDYLIKTVAVMQEQTDIFTAELDALKPLRMTQTVERGH